jgi:hypothetical protein
MSQLEPSPRPQHKDPKHLYEVILEGRPCWLYFDLEYSRTVNPSCNIKTVAWAFYEMLGRFCVDVLGARLDVDSIVELDSTTSAKYSQHVVVKNLLREGGEYWPLAFRNNAQAGHIVKRLVEYLKHHAQESANSPARHLFFRVHRDDESEQPADDTACLIDPCVYSRNRCFRLLFSSKFGKRRALLLSKGLGVGASTPMQLLDSMAAFVPAGTALFQHPELPFDFDHDAAARITKNTQPGP